MKIRVSHGLAVVIAALGLGISNAQEKEESGGSLGDLFNKVKDIKVPDSVTSLPSQITDLKESYLETAKTVEELKVEVGKLREEVASLRAENATLKKGVVTENKKTSLSDLLKPIEVSATELVAAYKENVESANEQYKDKYVKVIGHIHSFESGTQAFEIYLKAEGFDNKIKCVLKRDTNLHVEVLPNQGRLISRNDRRTLLTVGQPVAMLGTCIGSRLNVEMINCKVDGLEEKRKEEPQRNTQRR